VSTRRQWASLHRDPGIAATPTGVPLRPENAGMAGGSIRKLQACDAAPSFELPGIDGETHTLDSFEEAPLVVFACNRCS